MFSRVNPRSKRPFRHAVFLTIAGLTTAALPLSVGAAVAVSPVGPSIPGQVLQMLHHGTHATQEYGTSSVAAQQIHAPAQYKIETAVNQTSMVPAATLNCPCSVFDANSTPVTPTVNDSDAVELGMRFSSDVPGTVTGVRFYQGGNNSGAHTGHLWSGTGALLATVAFTNETASGWQTASFSSPVPIAANTSYVVSYFAPNGSYSADSGYFSSAADNGPLHGLASGADGSNGVFNYGGMEFPTSSFNDTNYWVDVAFMPTQTSTPAGAPAVVSTSPASKAAAVAVTAASTATFDQAVTPSSVTFTLKNAAKTTVAGTVKYNTATNTITFTPTKALAYSTSYTATVSGAANAGGKTMTSPYSWTFTTAAAPFPCNLLQILNGLLPISCNF